jgi:hypothetical protein
MPSRKPYPQHTSVLLLIAAGLLALVFCLPDAGNAHGGWFLPAALTAEWRRLGEPDAAWCSLKIVVASIALYLIIEALAILLGRLKLTRLAFVVFCLQAVAVFGVAAGAYYFCKALF